MQCIKRITIAALQVDAYLHIMRYEYTAQHMWKQNMTAVPAVGSALFIVLFADSDFAICYL